MRDVLGGRERDGPSCLVLLLLGELVCCDIIVSSLVMVSMH